ncbi:MAG: TRAP transporter substrate-binding protein [Ectothiorhodospiraceae bacterium]|nr:TRAP transporter substrate-binding protein [Ectothiorhodospiraceae bacterium]
MFSSRTSAPEATTRATYRRLLSAMAIATAMVVLPFTQAAANERVRWQIPTGAPTTLSGNEAIVYTAKFLETMSGGSITLRVYEPGELIPPFEVSDAVGEGRYPAGFTYTGYDEGTMPASSLFSVVPFARDPVWFSSWHYAGGGKELLNELYNTRNIHAVLCGMTGPQIKGWFREPIESLEDFDGLTIRFPAFNGRVLRHFGANITMIPAGDTYQALERGVIDAAKLGQPSVGYVFGFYEIAPYYMLPDWSQPNTATHLMINKDVWDGLQPSTQQMIESACMAATLQTLADTEYNQAKTLETFDELGLTALVLDDADLKKLVELRNQVLDDMAEEDAFFGRVLQSQREFSATYSVWADKGYLPRGLD